MGMSAAQLAFFAVLVTFMPATAGRDAQGSTKPLFTNFSTNMLCVGGPFVAMASVQPQELVVVRIGRNGIEGPERVRLNYDDVYGMKCMWDRVELLVRATGSDHFSRLPFTIRDNAIQQGQPHDIDYSISRKGPAPPEIEDFHEIPMLLKQTRGDWYVNILGVPSRRVYELHFVKTERISRNSLNTRFTVDLLEEGADRKVTKSVPLVRETRFEGGD